jgi:hypothetical protein
VKIILNADEYSVYTKRCTVEEQTYAPNVASNHALKTVVDMVMHRDIYEKIAVEQGAD